MCSPPGKFAGELRYQRHFSIMIFVTILWFIIYFSISTDTNNMILV